MQSPMDGVRISPKSVLCCCDAGPHFPGIHTTIGEFADRDRNWLLNCSTFLGRRFCIQFAQFACTWSWLLSAIVSFSGLQIPLCCFLLYLPFASSKRLVLLWDIILMILPSPGCRCSCRRSRGLDYFRCYLRSPPAQRLCRFLPRIPGRLRRRRTKEDPGSEGRLSSRWCPQGGRGLRDRAW